MEISGRDEERVNGGVRNVFTHLSLYDDSLLYLQIFGDLIDSVVFLQTFKNCFLQTFGAVLSGSLHVSELYYGTGESFLFTFQPEFQIFPWTGENTFFIKGNNESLIIGGGE